MQFGGSGRSCIGGLMPDLQPKAAVRPYWGTALELEPLIPLIRSKLSNTAGGGTSRGELSPLQAHITEECEGKEKKKGRLMM